MTLLSTTKMRLFAALMLTLSIAACQKAHTQLKSQIPPLPQDALIQVYFNHSESAEYNEPYRQKTRNGDNLEQKIIEAIAAASSTIDVAVQEFRLPKIAQALAEKHKSGVKVRVILENTYSRPWSSFTSSEIASLSERERDRYNEFLRLVDNNKDEQISQDEINQGDALVILSNAGIPIIDDTADGSAGSGLMHHKFVIVDNRSLIVTSANFTMSDIHGDIQFPTSLGNANNLLKIDSVDLATLFAQEFNLMWGDGPQGKPDSQFGVKKTFRAAQVVTVGDNIINVQFSPVSRTQSWQDSSNGLIAKTLETATQSVNLALFVFSEQRLANVLETNHQKGVQVKALIDPDFAYRSYSEALDMMGVALTNKCKYEADNHPWQNPITTVGIPLLLKGDLLHHKFGIVDQQTVITGSHNWSEAANTNNDETLLVIKNPTIAAHYEREFERLYAKAQLGITPALQGKIDSQQQNCQADD